MTLPRFLDPPAAAAALVVCLCLAAWTLRRRSRHARAARGVPSARSRPPSALVPSLVALLLLAAAARPYLGTDVTTRTTPGRDVMAVLDVSRSMLAGDVRPTRASAAARALLDLTAALRAEGGGDRVGLVVFAGTAHLFCPLTSDLTTVDQFVRSLGEGSAAAPGSDVAAALRLGEEALGRSGSGTGLLLLVSDGEEQEGSGAEAAARGLSVPVGVLGVGTPEGTRLVLPDGTVVKDRSGRVVTTKLDEERLAAVARAGSGAYRRLGPVPGDALALVREARPVTDRGGVTRTTAEPREVGPAAAAAAVLLLAVAAALGARDVWLAAVAAVLLLPAGASAGPRSDGRRAFGRGDYAAAEESFAAAAAESPDDPLPLRALGAARYRQGKFAAAEEAYARAARLSRRGRDLFASEYDRGNAAFRAGNPGEAVRSYRRALAVKPDDADALHNLALAEKAAAATPTPPGPGRPGEKDSGDEGEEEKGESAGAGDDAGPPPEPPPAPPSPAPPSSGDARPEDGRPGDEPPDDALPEDGPPAPSPGGAATPGDAGADETGPQGNGAGETGRPSDTPAAGSEGEARPGRPGRSGETEALSDAESARWLASLPEAPLMDRPPSGRRATSPSGQTW